MKRLVIGSACFALAFATGCGGKKSKHTSTTATAPTTSGTGAVNSGNGSTSPVGSTSGGVTPGGGTGTGGTGTGGGTTTTPPVIGGTGVFQNGSAGLPASSGDDWTVAAGDVDNDGDTDLVFGTNAGGVRLLLNDGQGAFTAAAGALPALTMNTTDLHLIDMDGDTDLDLVVSANYEPVRVLLNDGQGAFTLLGGFPAINSSLTYKLALGDVNGDTYPDVYMANAGLSTSTRGQDVLLLNDQAGGLVVSANALPVLQDDSLGAALADIDNDGDLDVYVANFGTNHALLVNDGTGTFTDQTARIPASTTGSTAVAAADLNQDGFVDFYVANEGLSIAGALPAGEADTYLINDGTGRFNDASALAPSNADASFNVRLVDVNGDTFPDVILANLRGVQRLYLNQSGVLVDSTANLPAANQTASNSMGIAVADLNGDRALDIVYAQRGATAFLFTGIPR